jgi:hypothetical protein
MKDSSNCAARRDRSSMSVGTSKVSRFILIVFSLSITCSINLCLGILEVVLVVAALSMYCFITFSRFSSAISICRPNCISFTISSLKSSTKIYRSIVRSCSNSPILHSRSVLCCIYSYLKVSI